MLQPAKTFRGYTDLIVYQKSLNSTVVLFRYYKNQKLIWIERLLVQQLLRAMGSVGANIAEGYGRHYKKDYRGFLSISRGSSFEVGHWINLILAVRPQDKEVLQSILLQNTEVSKILTTFMKKLDV